MYSEQNEALAQEAYNRWRNTHPTAPSWALTPNKHAWRDLINGMQRQRPLLCADDMEQACFDVVFAAPDSSMNIGRSDPITAPPFDTLPPEPPVEKPKSTKTKK